MKLRCPRCQRKLSVPDKFAGKGVRCPACNRAFSVPTLKEASGPGKGGAGDLDLGSLARLETSAEQMSSKDLSALESEVKRRKEAEPAGRKNVRTCPNCNKETLVTDPYVDVLCSNCWSTIPALIQGEGARKAGPPKARTLAGLARGGFYSELAACLAYPLPAMASLATTAVAAIAAALVPVAVLTGMQYLMDQGYVGTAQEGKTLDFSGVQWVLLAIFGFEVFFFSAVAIHLFLDVVRSTAIGGDAPPKLTWAPSQWGKSLFGYVVLCVYLALMTSGLLFLLVGSEAFEVLLSRRLNEVLAAGGLSLIAGMILISIGLPMNLLGMALGNVMQAISPARVFRSIGRTHAHYAFLVLILSTYGILFGGAFWSIVHDWFLPQVGSLSADTIQRDVLQVAFPLAAWGAVMMCYFYGTYVLARLHGLFARSFRPLLAFGTG